MSCSTPRQHCHIIFKLFSSLDPLQAIIYSMISLDIKPPYSEEPGAYGISCLEISSLPAAIDIAFTSTDGKPFGLTVPSSELSVGPFANNPFMARLLSMYWTESTKRSFEALLQCFRRWSTVHRLCSQWYASSQKNFPVVNLLIA